MVFLLFLSEYITFALCYHLQGGRLESVHETMQRYAK